MDPDESKALRALAHEINNHLGPIAAAVEILKRTVEPEGDVTFALETIERQVARLSALVHDLRRIDPKE